MPIRLKQTNIQSDQYYPLDEKALTDNTKVGNRSKESKEKQKKLTPFVKNVLKSTKNLAFDTINDYIPNAKEVKNSFKDTIEAAKEDAKTEFGPLLASAKSFVNKSKESDTSFKDKLAKEKKEIIDRLKQGKFYTSMEDEMNASLGLDDFGDMGDFGDFDFSGGGSDSFATVSEPDALSDEPFGGVKKGRTKTVNVSARQRQLKNKTTTIRASSKRSSSGSAAALGAAKANQLRLGDELISQTTSSVGSSILKQQEEIWARTYTANQQNFNKLYGYQNQILKGVNSIVDFNNNVMSHNVEAQMEFQGKLLAAQQDTLASLKELKDAMLVVTSFKEPTRSSSASHLEAQIANNPVGLDGKSYWKNIKANLGDAMGGSPLLSALMMTPMMGDMLSMSEDTGVKMINPLNMISKALFGALLSKNTKNKMLDFNELLSNFGGLFTARMNMLARYGGGTNNNTWVRTIGRILGTRTKSVNIIDMGLKDPNEVVGWTSRSDRTLNTVIPTLLAKQLAVMSGKDELYYDYKTGGFKSTKGLIEEVNTRRKMAYQNAETVSFAESIAGNGYAKLSKEEKNLLGNETEGQNKIREYVDLITKRLIQLGLPYDTEQVAINKDYVEKITDGIPKEHIRLAIRAFDTSYQTMTKSERLRFNGAVQKVRQNLQKNLDAINDEYKMWGGGNTLVESGYGDQLAEMQRSLDTDLTYAMTDWEKSHQDSATVLRKKQALLRRKWEIDKLKNAYSLNDTPTAKVEGIGIVRGGLDASVKSVPSEINKIFRLLAAGIPVYNQGKKLPDHILNLRKQIGVVDKEAQRLADETAGQKLESEREQAELMQEIYKGRARFSRRQRSLQLNLFSYLVSGNTEFQRNNFVNKGANAVIDGTTALYSSLMGAGGPDGPGLMDQLSYKEIDRMNAEAAAHAMDDGITKLEGMNKKLVSKKGGSAVIRVNEALIKLLKKGKETNEAKLKALDSGEDPSVFDERLKTIAKDIQKYASDFSNANILKVKNDGTNPTSEDFMNIYNTVKDYSSEQLNAAKDGAKKYIIKTDLERAILMDAKTYLDNGIVYNPKDAINKAVSKCITNQENAEFLKQVDIKPSEIKHDLMTNGVSLLTGAATVTAANSTVRRKRNKIISAGAEAAGNAVDDFIESDKTNAIFEQMQNLVGFDEQNGTFDNPIEKVTTIYKKELKQHPELKAKWDVYTKKMSKRGKKIGARAIKDSAEIYRHGGNFVEAIKNKDFKDALNEARKTGKSTRTLFGNIFGGIGDGITELHNNGLDVIDIRNENIRKINRRIGTGIGGGLGLLAGGPFGGILGAGAGAIIGGKIGKAMDKKFPVIRGALLQQGHIDAPTMKPRDLYALVMSVKGRLGHQLRGLPEFKDLEAVAYKRSFGQALSDTAKNVGRKLVGAAHIAKMMAHRTLPYKNLVDSLDMVLNSGKSRSERVNVYGYDKFALYAAVNALSTDTKQQRKIKEALMGTKEYRRLETSLNTGKSWLRTVLDEKITNAKRNFNRLRHWKYRFFIDFLKANGYDESIADEKDPSKIWLALNAWGSMKKNQRVYETIKQSKAYIELEKAVLKRGKARTGHIREIRKDVKHSGNRTKYATLLFILSSYGVEVDRSNVQDIYNGMIGVLERWERNGKDLQANAVRRSKQWKNLCAECHADTGASNNKPERVGLFGKLRGLFSNDIDLTGSGSHIDITKEKFKATRKALKENYKRLRKTGFGEAASRIYDRMNHKRRRRKNKKGLLGWFANLSKTSNNLKAKTERKKRHNQNVQNAMQQGFNRTGDEKTGLLAGILSALLSTNRRITEVSDNTEESRHGLGGILSSIGSVGAIIAGLVSAAGLALVGGGAFKRIKEAFTGKLKNEDVATKTGYLSGIDSDNVDSSKWFSLERAGNIKNQVKAGFMGGGVKAMFSNVKKGAKALFTKNAGVAKKAAEKATKSVPEIIENGIKKILDNPKLIKKIGPNIWKKLKSLPKTIANRFKNGVVHGAQELAKGTKEAFKAVPLAGWIFAAVDAIGCFAGGMNNAPRYFTVSPSDTTAGMRTTAGLVGMFKSIISSVLSITGVGTFIAIALDFIVPDDWLVQVIYGLVANEADKEELKLKRDEEERRAKYLGTDAKTLAAAENHSLFQKSLSGIKAAFTDKTYAEIEKEKTAKKLGMTVEEYDAAMGNYNAAKEGSFKDKYPEFAKLKSPSDARRAFNDPNRVQTLEAEARNMFATGDMESIYAVFKAINDKKIGRMDTSIKNLNSSFKDKLKKFFNDKEVGGYDLAINEGIRNPFTQFAYYSKGRANATVADEILKLAGFGGLSFWDGDNSTNTKTLNSNHLGGNAVDLKIAGLSRQDQERIGRVASRYGITWGGNWKEFGSNGDAPHFEDASGSTEHFARGGIVGRLKDNSRTTINYLLDQGDKIRARLNPGEMVLTKTQQTALFNKIKKYERDELGTTSANPVRLNESPLLTNDRDTLVILNEALDLQHKIYEEQTRHNKVTEKFFEVMIQTMVNMFGGSKKGYTEQIKQMSENLSSNSMNIASGY